MALDKEKMASVFTMYGNRSTRIGITIRNQSKDETLGLISVRKKVDKLCDGRVLWHSSSVEDRSKPFAWQAEWKGQIGFGFEYEMCSQSDYTKQVREIARSIKKEETETKKESDTASVASMLLHQSKGVFGNLGTPVWSPNRKSKGWTPTCAILGCACQKAGIISGATIEHFNGKSAGSTKRKLALILVDREEHSSHFEIIVAVPIKEYKASLKETQALVLDAENAWWKKSRPDPRSGSSAVWVYPGSFVVGLNGEARAPT